MLFFFILKDYFDFCSEVLGHVGKRFDKKAKGNLIRFYVMNWETNNCNTHITQFLKKQRLPENEFGR